MTPRELRRLLAAATMDLSPLLGSDRFADAFLAKTTAYDDAKDMLFNNADSLLAVVEAAEALRAAKAAFLGSFERAELGGRLSSSAAISEADEALFAALDRLNDGA